MKLGMQDMDAVSFSLFSLSTVPENSSSPDILVLSRLSIFSSLMRLGSIALFLEFRSNSFIASRMLQQLTLDRTFLVIDRPLPESGELPRCFSREILISCSLHLPDF